MLVLALALAVCGWRRPMGLSPVSMRETHRLWLNLAGNLLLLWVAAYHPRRLPGLLCVHAGGATGLPPRRWWSVRVWLWGPGLLGGYLIAYPQR